MAGKGDKNRAEQPKKAAQTMTASSSSLAQPAQSFDIELDALFSQAAKPTQASTLQAVSSKRKRDRVKKPGEAVEKRVKANRTAETASITGGNVEQQPKSDIQGESQDEDDESSDGEQDDEASLNMSEIEKEIAEQGLTRTDDEDDDDDRLDEEEDDAASTSSLPSEEEDEEEQEEEESEEEDDANAKPPVHESIAKSREQQRIRRKLEERSLESKEVRDKRTIFLANVPIACVQSKTLSKALKKHIVDLSPYPSVTRIEALRYRSVAFSVPTADYAAESGADAASNEKRRARARSFKDAVDAAGEEGDVSRNGKPYLNAKQKRKVAYINHEINDKAKAVNAYVTLDKLAERDVELLKRVPGSSDDRAGRLLAPILAALTAAHVDDTLFEGRHLRADLATPLTLPELVSAGLDRVVASVSTSDVLSRILSGGGKRKDDQSRTLFVGNLDFEADEEDLRAMLEAVVKEERGLPPQSAGRLGKEISTLPPFEAATAEATAFLEATWVQSVRIIRDAATQMGKGFAYVNFLDDECVDELMAIWEADEAFLSAGRPGSRSKDDGKREDGSRREFKRRLKLNKRPLRLARCKNTGGGKGGQKKGTAGRKATEDQGEEGGSQQATTPKKKPDNRRRSMGAPTPDGTSPSAALGRKGKVLSPTASGSPSRTSSSASKFPSSSSTLIPNPPPQFARSEADQARIALKRNDPDRQAKRMAKKERQKQQLKMASRRGAAAVAGAGAKDRVNLKIGKKAKTGKTSKALRTGGVAGSGIKGKGKAQK